MSVYQINSKAGITNEGGHAVQVIAGETLARGEVVQITQPAGGADGKVYKNGIDSDMPVGVVYANAATNAAVWIVVGGIAYVLPNAADAPIRGYVIYSSSTTAGRVDQAAAAPAIGVHVREVGHWLESEVRPGVLTRAIVHFN